MNQVTTLSTLYTCCHGVVVSLAALVVSSLLSWIQVGVELEIKESYGAAM